MKYCSFTIAFLLMAVSCKQDKCKDVNCQNDGVCNDGRCTCVVGYEGEYCQITSRDYFKGSWNVSETPQGSSVATQYTINVIDGHNIAEAIILNLHQLSDSTVVYARLLQKFALDSQVVTPGITMLSGTGTLDSTGNTVSLSYQVKDADTTITYNAIWTK